MRTTRAPKGVKKFLETELDSEGHLTQAVCLWYQVTLSPLGIKCFNFRILPHSLLRTRTSVLLPLT